MRYEPCQWILTIEESCFMTSGAIHPSVPTLKIQEMPATLANEM